MPTLLSEKYAAAARIFLDRQRFDNLQPTTLNNYERTISAFGAFLNTSEEEDIFAAVEAWREHLIRSGAKPSTVNQYLTRLSVFFSRAAKRSFPSHLRFPENPIDADSFQKAPPRPYETILTDEQVRKLYRNAPPTPSFAATWPRNYAILMLLLNEKIRNAELLDLTLDDLDFRHHELTVRSGKGRKFRVTDMTELTETAIELYLNSGLRPSGLPDDAPLFGTEAPHVFGNAGADRPAAVPWHRGSSQWLSSLTERTVCAVTGVRDVRTHDLRHVGSRVCLNAGESMEQLQGELGHSQLNTTQIDAGRMNARRDRESAKATLAERDRQAAQNRACLNSRIIQLPIPSAV